MTHILPPLNALRAFEAAARHLSFKRAAQELHVTPAAISHQVRGLEERLGIVLFKRLHSGLVLTSAGRAYLEPVRQAFSGLASATAKLNPEGMTALVHVGIHPAFKFSLIQAPLAAFRDRELGIAIRITQPAGMYELLEGKVDLIVERGIANHQGYRCDPLSSYRDPANIGWFLIGPLGTADCPEVRLLRSWILERGSVVPLRLKSGGRARR